MNTTLFLAQMYGPIILSIGLGVFVSRNYYIKIYRELEKDALAVLIFGMASMACGIAQLYFHNVWDTLPQIIVSIIGWGFLVKGTLFVIWPNLVDRAGKFWVNKKLIPLAGSATLIIGAYLSWFAYFS